MVKRSFSGRLSLWLPIVLAAVVYLASTTDRAVTDYDEGFYAQAAKHMAESGDWVTPYANHVRFLEKPPLLYWVTAASFKIFGINEFALRLPTAFAVVGVVWLVMLIVRRLADDSAVLVAGLSTAFSMGMYIFTRETLHDIWLVFFLVVAVYGFLAWYLNPERPLRPALLFYGAMGGAFLCKSVIGAVFPLSIVLLFFLFSKERPKWKTLHVLPGLILFLLITVPWHWIAAARNKGFLEFFFIGEQFLRFVGKREAPIVESVPLPVFWGLLLVWFFPWTAFLPTALAIKRRSFDPGQRVLFRLASAWSIVILGFFSISARLEHYVFPVLPALSMFIAGAVHRLETSKAVLWAFRSLAILGIFLAVIGLTAGIWFYTADGVGLIATDPAGRTGSSDFSILANMPPDILSNLIHPAWISIVTMAVGFWIALRFEMRRNRSAAFVCLAAVMGVICGMTHWSMNLCEDLISSKKFGVALAAEIQQQDRIVVVGDYEAANSLGFYQPMKVEVVDGTAYTLPDDPRLALTREEYSTVWDSSQKVFVLLPEEKYDTYASNGKVIKKVLHRALVRNRQ